VPVPPDPISTYDLTVGTMLDVEDGIDMLDPADTPLLSSITASGRPVIARGSISQRSYTWLTEERLIAKTTLTASHDTSTTTLTVGSGEVKRFLKGQVLLNDSTREKYLVVDVDYTADTMTVVRSIGSVAAAAGTSGDTIRAVSWMLPEGSRPSYAAVKDRVELSNKSMIMGPKALSMTGTEQVIRKYGVRSEWSHQAALKYAELIVELEYALVYSELYEDTSEKRRTMDGIWEQIDTNVDSNSGPINDTRLIEVLQDIVDVGGPTTEYALVIGSEGIKQFSTFETGAVQINRMDRGRGTIVNYLDTDFGRVTKVYDRNLASTDALLLPAGHVELCTLRPFIVERLAKVADSDEVMMLMEIGCKVHAERWAAKFSGLTAA
jgi:hypothetical protein